MKLAIFDLDGVLVDTSNIHTSAFRMAVLEVVSFEASLDPMLDASDGVRTVDKLEKLRAKYHLSSDDITRIDQLKQEYTLVGFQSIKQNQVVIDVMEHLSHLGFFLAVASNSRREYVDTILERIGAAPYLNFTIAGNEVGKPKPDPEIFQTVMDRFSILPCDTTIFEDSDAGILAATRTGADVIRIDPHELITMEKVKGA